MTQTQTQLTKANLVSLIKDYVIYNQWANNTLVEWLKTKPVEIMDKEIPSSFPSLQQTLLHIWDVERGWLGHLKQAPEKSFRMEGFDGTLQDILQGMEQTCANFVAFASSLTEDTIDSDCSFSIPYVGSHTMPAFELIQHTMNHGTYHRGQLITIGRNLGLTDAPMTDYMFYLLRVKGK